MIVSTGWLLTSGERDQLVVEVRLVQRADEPLVAGDRDLREVVLAHQPDRGLDRLAAFDRQQLARQPGGDQVARGQAGLVEEALLAHPVVIEHLAEVARAVIVEDDDDDVVAREADRVSCSRPAIADPAELPAKMPSSRAMRRVISAASLSVTFSKWSITSKSTFFGRKSSPMPSVTYGIDLVLVEDAGLLVLLEDRPVGVDAPDLDRRDSAPSDSARRR